MRLIRYDLERQAALLELALGGPFGVRYASDTAPGSVLSHSVRLPITGERLPDGLASIEVEGPSGSVRLDPAPSLTHRVSGFEGRGTVRITFVFSDGARSVHEQRLVVGAPDARTSELGGFLLDGVPMVHAGRLYLAGRSSVPLRPAADGRHHARVAGLIHVVERGNWVGTHDAITGAVVWRMGDDELQGPLGARLAIDRGMRTVRLEHERTRTDVKIDDGWATEIEQGEQTVRLEFDEAGLLRVAAARGESTTLEYDELGRLSQIAAPDTRLVFRREELPDGFRVAVTNGFEIDERLEVRHRGDEVHLTKRCCGREPVTVIRRPAGTETMRPDGARAMQVVGGERSIVRVELPSGAARESEVTRSGAGGAPTTVTRIGDEQWSTRWVPEDRVVRRESPAGRAEVLELDEHGRVTSRRSAAGGLTRFRYDGARLTRLDGPFGEWELEWDDDTTVTWSGPTGTLSAHRSADRVHLVDEHGVEMERRDTDGGFESTVNRHQYVSAERTGDGRRVALGASHLMTVASDGARATVRSDGVTEITWDQAGRPVSVSAEGGERRYEWHGRRLRLATDGETEIHYTWDGPELLGVEQRGGARGTISYRRDGQGRPAGIDVLGERFEFGYEDGSLTVLGPLVFDLDDRWMRPARATVGSLTETFGYDDQGRLVERDVRHDGDRVLRLRLEYDRAGRIVRRRLDGAQNHDVAFRYDGGRLVREVAEGRELRFGHDDSGRMTELAGRTFGVDTSGRLENVDGNPVTYTESGRLARIDLDGAQIGFGYAPTGELVSIDSPAGTTRIDRDPLGRPVRIARADGRSLGLVWDETGPAAILDGDGEVVERHVRRPGSPTPELVVRGSTVVRVVTDQTGTVLAMIDADSGAVTGPAWSAYGEALEEPADLFGFGGGLVLSIDPLVVDIGRRSYLPAIGRWLQWDPNLHEGGGTDLYGYAANDPVNRHDPTGAEVQRCSGWVYTAWRDSDGDIRYVAMPARHQWLKTGKYESGQDVKPGTGVYTQWSDHRGRWYPGTSCEPIEDVDEDCVNKRIKPGTDIGLYGSPIKVTDHTVPGGFELTIPMICWQTVADVLDDCHIDNIPGGMCELPEETMPPAAQQTPEEHTPDLGYTPLEPSELDYTPDVGYTPQGGMFGQ